MRRDLAEAVRWVAARTDRLGAVGLHLTQGSGLWVEDETADLVAGGYLWAGSQAGEAYSQRGVDVVECTEAPGREDAVVRERLAELVLGCAVEAAALVHHHHYSLGAEQALGGGQGADCVVGYEAAGVADDVGVAALQAEHREQVNARVHAREHRDPAARPRVQAGGREFLGPRS